MSQDDQKDDKNIQKDEAEIEPGNAEEAAELNVPEDEVPEALDEEVTAEDVEIPGTEEYTEDNASDVVELPDFRPGDTVKVYYKIIEGNKTRIQPFEGIVIAKKGAGVSKTFTVRKIAVGNIGVERIFPLFSPNITKLEVTRKGLVRKSKLYYLRDKIGKAAVKVKERKDTKTS